MKGLSVSCIAWPAALDEAAFARLARLEVAGVEVAPTRIASWDALTPGRIAAYRARIEAHGLRASSLQAVFYGRPELQLLGEPAAFQAMRSHLERVAELGSTLGAEVIVFGAPAQRRRGELNAETAIAIATERLALLGEVAGRGGLVIGIEPVPPAYGADFLLSWREVAALVRTVGHAAVRVHLDTACVMLAGDDIAEAVECCAPILAHFHAAEPGLGDFAARVAEHEAAASALRHVAFPGWVAIEMKERAFDPLAAVEEAVQAVARTYFQRAAA